MIVYFSCSLIAGINRHGVGKWREILDDPSLRDKVCTVTVGAFNILLLMSLILN